MRREPAEDNLVVGARHRAAPARRGFIMNAISARLAAASGALFVVAIMVGPAMAGTDDVNLARAGYLLAVLGFTAFVVFVGFLHRVMRLAEGPDGWAATVALGAGLLYSAIRFEAQAPRMVEAYRGDALSPELARTLVDLNDMAFVVGGLLLGLYAAFASWVCIKHRLLSRLLGWFGLVSGILAIVAGMVGMVDPDLYIPLPFLAGLVWTLVVSILLTLRPQRLERSSAPPVPTPRRAGMAGAV